MVKKNNNSLKYITAKKKTCSKEYKYPAHSLDIAFKTFSVIDSNRKERIQGYK